MADPQAPYALDDDRDLRDSLVSGLMEALGELPFSFSIREAPENIEGEKSGEPGNYVVVTSVRPAASAHRQDVVVKGKDGIYKVEIKANNFFSGSAAAEKKFRKAVSEIVNATIISSGRKPMFDPAMLPLVEAVERALPDARYRMYEETVGKLVEALVETHDPLASVNADIGASNAAAQIRFLNNFHTYGAEEVTRNAGSRAKNVSQTASRWKSEGRIFSVPFQGKERFPAFQFKDGRPLPLIADVLAALPQEMSPWERAFWFVSSNGWLDGASPRDCFRTPERVVEAARLEGEAIAG